MTSKNEGFCHCNSMIVLPFDNENNDSFNEFVKITSEYEIYFGLKFLTAASFPF